MTTASNTYGTTFGRTADELLMAAVAEIESFIHVEPDVLADRHNRFVQGMVHGGVPFVPDFWFGPLTQARRKALSRAARHLEDASLADRVTEMGRDRVKFLRPTLAGVRRVLALAGETVDLGHLLAGLRRTTWGLELADELEAEFRPVSSGR